AYAPPASSGPGSNARQPDPRRPDPLDTRRQGPAAFSTDPTDKSKGTASDPRLSKSGAFACRQASAVRITATPPAGTLSQRHSRAYAASPVYIADVASTAFALTPVHTSSGLPSSQACSRSIALSPT